MVCCLFLLLKSYKYPNNRFAESTKVFGNEANATFFIYARSRTINNKFIRSHLDSNYKHCAIFTRECGSLSLSQFVGREHFRLKFIRARNKNKIASMYSS